MNTLMDWAVVWLPAIAAAIVVLRATAAKPKKKKHQDPAPLKKKGRDPWVVEMITEEQIDRERLDRHFGYSTFTMERIYYQFGGPKNEPLYLKDFVLVRVRKRYPVQVRYQSPEQLRIGAVEVNDPEFDVKLAELRGVAEERAATLNSNP